MRVYTWERKANKYPDEQSELGNNHNIASAMIWQQYVNLRWFFNNVFQFEFVNRKIWSNRNWQYDYIPTWRKGRRNPPGTGVFSVAWNRNFNEKVDKKGIDGQRIDIFSLQTRIISMPQPIVPNIFILWNYLTYQCSLDESVTGSWDKVKPLELIVTDNLKSTWTPN